MIYAAAVPRRSEKRKEGIKTGWDPVYHTKNGAFLSFTRPLKANVLFCRFFFESDLVQDQTQVSGAVFSWLFQKTLLS